MTNRNTRRALIASLMALILCVSSLLGTTYAWFTDEVTSSNNKIVAGNLDVELEYYDTDNKKWIAFDDQTNVFKENTLWEMRNQGYLTEEEYQEALAQELVFKNHAAVG